MLLSVVLVVRRHQAWVRPCLRSVLDDSPSGVEVIVVDDASQDHTTGVVADAVGDDPRVRVHRSEDRQGTAASRETGLSLATGDYVWFVEATDLLLPGGLAAVCAGLAPEPDVLLVGEVERDLYGGERDVPVGRPGKPPAMRDRVVRRGHLLGIDRPVGGALTDVALATAVLARATQVARLGPAAYAHRLLPARVVRALSDLDPWEVFGAYDRAFAELSAGDGTTRVELATAMVEHEQALLADVQPARRREFFHRMSHSVATHGGGAEPADLPARLQRSAIETDHYGRYTALVRSRVPVRTTVRAAARKLPRSRRALRARTAAAVYAAERRGPLDPQLAVFAAYWGAAYSCNPRAIYEKARELAPWLRGVWVVKPGSVGVLPDGVEHVVEGSRDYYRVMARATYFVNNVNFPNDIVKRSGQVHLQTHHGTPLKTMGLDLANVRHSSMGLNLRRLMKRVQRWDYSISANPFSTEVWERVYPSGTYESLETGYPRNDVLATATPEHRRKVRAELGIAEEQKVLLYTPTHRESAKEYVPLLDVDDLVARLGPGVTVLMRTHYFYRGAAAGTAAGGRVVDVTSHPSIEDLSIASDVLVTDYSSLMFDYAVLDRPIVIYAPDWESYSTERGTYFDLMAEPPGAVATTQDELVEAFRSGRDDAAGSTALRQAFRQKFCALEDGGAAERVVRRLWPATTAH